jgi:hypothetical protein
MYADNELKFLLSSVSVARSYAPVVGENTLAQDRMGAGALHTKKAQGAEAMYEHRELDSLLSSIARGNGLIAHGHGFEHGPGLSTEKDRFRYSHLDLASVFFHRARVAE